MAAQQDEVQPIVGKLPLGIVRWSPFGPHRQQRRLAPGDCLGPETLDNLPMGGGVQPAGRVGRQSFAWPAFRRPCERLTQGIFSQIEATRPGQQQ